MFPGAACVNLIENKYYNTGGQTVIQGHQYNVSGGQAVFHGGHEGQSQQRSTGKCINKNNIF